MVRRCVREIVLWGGLAAVGVGIGTFAVPLPSAQGQLYSNHNCRDVDCFEMFTLVGGFCGWCNGGNIDPRFYKCIPTPGISCTESEALYGRYTCYGYCTGAVLTACVHAYTQCQ